MSQVHRVIALSLTFCCLFLIAATHAVSADEYPSKPIHMLLGYGPGGSTDTISRIIADKLSQRLGQRVLIENHPGGGTTIALNVVAKSEPDGYKLMMTDLAFSAAPALFDHLPFDPAKDFEPVIMVAVMPAFMAVTKDLPVKTVKDFVELAKASPGKLNYATDGLGSLGHLGPEQLKAIAKINLVEIPYHSGAQAIQALLQNDVQLVFATAPPLLPFESRIHLLAVTGDERLPILPDVPTFKESGYPGMDVNYWIGVVAPRGTDKKIVAKLNNEINAVLKMPEVSARISKIGAELIGGTPEYFGGFLKSQTERWSKFIPTILPKKK
jgi:tripartite-type tricarboxylate transporter receptor subunit TctC